ncbi:hypothetical protein [Bradyrhizobium sp. AZCC 1577]|uniref:hypothetical protein n=1 Tax=Bradyrhizobium sp. AZCC 1577 TaxID=3117019 RepID=UPI002FEEBAD3
MRSYQTAGIFHDEPIAATEQQSRNERAREGPTDVLFQRAVESSASSLRRPLVLRRQIASWLEVLRSDKRDLHGAQQIADWMRAQQPPSKAASST